MVNIVKNIVKRKVTSIYCNEDIWQDFKNKCKVTGQSTCHVLEAFMYAFSKALPDQPITTLPTVNVHLTVNRIVRRVHRIRNVVDYEEEVSTEGDSSTCAFCNSEPVVLFGYREPGFIREIYACRSHFFNDLYEQYKRSWWLSLREFAWQKHKLVE